MREAWHNLCVRAGLGEFVCPEGHPVTRRKPCSECGSRKRAYRGLIPHDLRRSAAKAARRHGCRKASIMATGGWKTRSIFRRYAIVSDTDQRAFAETIEKSRAAENSPAFGPASLKPTPTVPPAATLKPQ